MRVLPAVPLLLVPVALLAAACDDSSNPIAPEEPPVTAAEAPLAGDPAVWADGYLWAGLAKSDSFAPLSYASFNRSGGTMMINKVAGSTGRYIVRFRGLSTLVGTKNIVHVSASGAPQDAKYCKPVGAFLVRDSVEVRCFRMGTGAAVNAEFYLNVVGKRDDRAFAFANQAVATNYAPASGGSWNPAGTTRVYRDAVGEYRVVFNGLGARFSTAVGGHVQVKGVTSNKVYCNVVTWGGTPNLTVSVACYTPAGRPADSKFTTLVTPPAAHLAYAWTDSPMTSQYNAYSVYSSNPVGGAIIINRLGVGLYDVRWIGVDPEIRDNGNVQVTAWGEGGAQCTVAGTHPEGARVQCFAANGVAMDNRFTVLFGS